ncbi:hypothetical protein KSC_084380 [Ktedonobacter sp. SOSP1-52]|nr:hypothetical protein KSC_084380 [Ktedonobacter sp. SOSP1-52]
MWGHPKPRQGRCPWTPFPQGGKGVNSWECPSSALDPVPKACVQGLVANPSGALPLDPVLQKLLHRG